MVTILKDGEGLLHGPTLVEGLERFKMVRSLDLHFDLPSEGENDYLEELVNKLVSLKHLKELVISFSRSKEERGW